MDTSEAMSTLRRMMNDRKLSASDAAALDVVDRMLRDLKAAEILKNAVNAGLLSPEEHDEKLGRLPTFAATRPTSIQPETPGKGCQCIHSLGQALDLAASLKNPLTLTPCTMGGETRWNAVLGSVSRFGSTPGDVANELVLAYMHQVGAKGSLR